MKTRKSKSPPRKRSKSSQYNTDISSWFSTAGVLEDSQELIWRASRRWNDEDIEQLCDKLLMWSKHQNSLFLEDFLGDIGLSSRRYRDIKAKSEYLQQVDELVKERIGSRQRYFALMGRIDASMTRKTLHNYLHEWDLEAQRPERWRKEDKEHQIEMAKIRQDQDNNKEPVKVIVVDK